MSTRYFKTATGTAQYGNLTEDGLQVLLDAGHEEITAKEYEAAVAAAEEAAQAARAAAVPQASHEQPKEASADGGNGRKRRR